MRQLYLLLLLALLFSCGKEPVHPPEPPPPCGEPCDTMEMKLLWQSPIESDTGDYYSEKPYLYQGNVVITKMFGGPNKIVRLYEGNTGALLWTWDNSIDIPDGSEMGGFALFNNRFIISSFHEINLIDLNSGSSIWRSDTQDKNGCGWPRINLFNDQIYHTHKPCGVFPDSSYLVRSSVYAPRWDTLFRLGPTESGVAPAIEPGVLWVSGQGDSIYIFQNRAADSHGNQVDVYGFNLAERKVVWKITNIDKGSSIEPPAVYDDKVYFLEHHTLTCLKPLNGEIVWQKDFPSGLYATDILFAEGKLIIHPNNHSLYALDPDTGAEIWNTTNTGGADADLEYYHGYIFYASGGSNGIYIHRVSDGALVKRILSPNRYDFGSVLLTRPIAIDESTGRLYTTDGRFVLCYQIKL